MSNMTKTVLANGLKKLLNERPLSRITIQELTNECHINRQTFYYHFRDIYELVFWMMDLGIENYLEENKIDRDDNRLYIYALFAFFRENRRIVHNAYDSYNRIQYESLFREYAMPRFLAYLKEQDAADGVREDDLDFIAQTFTLALSGFLIKWIEEGMPDENRVQLDRFYTLIDGGTDSILKRFQKK